jgi:hypothetical protein
MRYYEELARKAERESNWWDAYRCWMNVGEAYGREHASACKTIAEAVDLGNRYRELVGYAYERWENHEINNAELYDIQCRAHQQVYGH